MQSGEHDKESNNSESSKESNNEENKQAISDLCKYSDL